MPNPRGRPRRPIDAREGSRVPGTCPHDARRPPRTHGRGIPAMKVNELLTLEVADLALGGQAVARHDGFVVFVDRGLPGDRVTARVTRPPRRRAEARLESVERPSPERVAAPCPHFGPCGGCRFQDLSYGAQCRIKHRQVVETLTRIGGIREPRVRDLTPAPETFGYRNKMEFSFHPGAAPVLGLHERGGYDRVFALERCLLPSALTVEIVRATQRFAASHAWRAYHPARHEGVVRFLVVRHLPHTDQCAVGLIAATDEIPGLAEWARAIAALAPAVRSVTLGL